MKKISKRKKKLLFKVKNKKEYTFDEALEFLKENSNNKFVESLDVAINLSIDTSKTDQNIRGVVNLPKGTGKNISVAVMAKGDKAKEAKDNGDLYGSIKPKEISNAFTSELKVEINPSEIDIKQEINKIGKYKIKINLHSEVSASVTVDVQKIDSVK